MQAGKLFLGTQPLLPIQDHQAASRLPEERKTAAICSFASVLEKEQQRYVRFSQHAVQRLNERGIAFTEGELTQLDAAVEKMAAKGAKESLVCLHDAALIVSVPNRTVITAMDGIGAKESIFTNIDSAAIL